ncbi:MAG: 23S rRNA (guanosine(2251)-2'-O)-methyltransferase RlmB [Bacteroidia bacterium]|nr:23S rRNA (guanosine(2251)-2'-O)-methyltransferase RlmB [Bacteroidia bacterium]HQU99771.1 23S rRNA (guanosine(2251)-2'-O)-methyltransferase RlmB [Bacteroidia bacterium]
MYKHKPSKAIANKDFIFGIHAIIEAIDAGKQPDKILIQVGISNPLIQQLKQKLKQNDWVYQQVPIEKLNSITTKNHQGAIAFITEIEFENLSNIIARVFENGRHPFILILDRVTDVRNFGAIARTAVCAGVDALVIPSRGAAQINADAVKTSAGALHKLAVCKVNDLKQEIQFLKNSGLQIVACTEKTNQLHFDVAYTQPTAIIMGAEDTGISPEFLKLSDVKVRIPMSGLIDSLNVSVSAAIVMYEAVRQRNTLK